MAFNRWMTWEGQRIKFPTGMTWGFQDISSSESGRTLSGKMNKDIVATKRTLSCSWSCLSDSESSALLGAIKIKTYGNLDYPDAFAGTNLIKRFYTGDATATMKTIEDNEVIWDVSIEFVEQ